MEKEIVPALLGQGAGLQENAVDLHIPLLDLNSILRLEPVADNNEEGSLTPTTKTKKVQLGDIEVNNIDIGEYNKITRSEQNKMKQLLNKELNKLKVQIAACETAIDQKDDKTKLFQTCNASLITLKDELELSEGKLNEIMNSTFIYEVESDSNFSFATIYQRNICNTDQVSDYFLVVLNYGLYSGRQLLQNLVGIIFKMGFYIHVRSLYF